MLTFVLVHGAWTDSRIWTNVQHHLTMLGFDSVAPAMPPHSLNCAPCAETSLDVYVDAIVEAARTISGPIVLVGHSTAGPIVSLAAERCPDLVSHLVYVAGFLPRSGQSCWELLGSIHEPGRRGFGGALRQRNGMVMVDPYSFVRLFCPDVPADVAGVVVNSLRPEPLGPLMSVAPLAPERWGSLPRSYVHTLFDAALSFESQCEMAAAARVERVATMQTSHFPMLSEPMRLAQTLVNLTQDDGALRPLFSSNCKGLIHHYQN